MRFQRAILKAVQGYVPGEQPRRGERVIKLNTNENPYPPSPRVAEAIAAVDDDGLRRYPDPYSVELRTVAAKRYGFEGPDWVIAGNGSDELLAMIIRTFVDPGDTVFSCYPTYVLYETLAKLHGTKFSLIDLDENFGLTGAFYSLSGRVLFFPRPNAPSGVAAPLAGIKRLCKSFPGLVVLDEAYADFGEDDCMAFAREFDNVIVTRTFSKSYSLCGLRAGLAFSRPEIIAELMKTKDSYNLNALSQAGATAALRDEAYMLANRAKVLATRARLTSDLRRIGFDVPESSGNYVLARWAGSPSTRDIFLGLREKKILVRYFDSRRLENALRISVGTDAETDALLGALSIILRS
jgi:histidinol-phosphate aminotransferase